jgi:hypothetical protein
VPPVALLKGKLYMLEVNWEEAAQAYTFSEQ